MAGFRDSNLLILSLSTHSHTLQAGLGVSPELIQPPTHSLPVQVFAHPTIDLANPSRRWSDYSFDAQPGLVQCQLFCDPEQGAAPSVLDWKALDAFFRHVLFTCLELPNPPLAQHILLSVPPSISNTTRDKLTQLFFENLQAPALFLADSPLLHLLAANRASGLSIDLGTHSTLLGFVHESIVLRHCCAYFPLGESDCDDYLIALLLAHIPSLPVRLCPPNPESPKALYQALANLVTSLKADGHVRFQPELSDLSLASLPNPNLEDEENAITDVAQALVTGKVDKLLGRQVGPTGAPIAGANHSRRSTTATGKRLQAEILKESDTIIVSLPSLPATSPTHAPPDLVTNLPPPSSEPSELQIGKLRHRHAEPLFSPAVLAIISPTFARHGLEEWATRYTPTYIENAGDGMVAAALTGFKKIDGQVQRREVSEHVVLTGQGGLTCRTEGLVDFIGKELGAKPLKIPDYFAEYKSHPELLGFLGGSIVAKLVFNDASASKLWMSKPDYSREGPFVSRKIGDVNASSSFSIGQVS